MRGRLLLAVPVLLLGVSAPAAAAWLLTGTGGGVAAASALTAPGVGAVSVPTNTTLTLTWGAPTSGPAPTGYLVLRGGVAVATGGCADTMTRTSTAVTCTDSGLTPSTTYSYAVRPVRGTSWVGPATAAFSGTTTSFQLTGHSAVGGSRKYRFSGVGSSGTMTISVEVCSGTVATCTTTTAGWVESVSFAPAGPGAWQTPPTGTKLDLYPGPYTATATQGTSSWTYQFTI